MALGAPVRDLRGEVVAGLSLAGPVARLTADRVRQLSLPLRRAAEEASRRLGWIGPERPRPTLVLARHRNRRSTA